jgi:hypothetical protein
MLLANQDLPDAESFMRAYGGEILIFVLFVLVVTTLMVLVPQLLRAHLRKQELQHEEHLQAMKQGVVIEPADESSKAAGRTAMLVPMVVVISAATVTCFLIAYRAESAFSITLAVWAVAGVVSLAAITGGVALLGRLAQLNHGIEDTDEVQAEEQEQEE